MPDVTDSPGIQAAAAAGPDRQPGGPAEMILTSLALAQASLPVLIFDTDLRVTWVNVAAERLLGVSAPGSAGRRLGEVLAVIDDSAAEQSMRSVLGTGEPSENLELTIRDGDDPAGERVWSCILSRVSRPDGSAIGVMQTMREVTERSRSQRRLALADQASARIGTTLDIRRTAEELLDVALGELADAGAVDLLGNVLAGGQPGAGPSLQRLRLLRVAVRWPPGRQPSEDFLRHGWSEMDPSRLYHERLSSGMPIFLPQFGQMTLEDLRRIDATTYYERMQATQAAGGHSMMLVPLAARGVIMGVIVLYRVGDTPSFTPADLALAQDLASRAAVWIDNARHYTRERATALELQRGLLPRRIPAVRGVEVAYRYRPAETAAEIGGDWFDVIPLPGGRCALIVGDVSGHDMRAASLMGQLRTATHTLATLELTPAQILSRLDRLAEDLTGDETSATCAYLVLDPDGGCEVALAGHPQPAVASPGAGVTFLDLPPGIPLGMGLGPGVPYQTATVHVPPGSTLLLYTDGLVENPGASLDDGLSRLGRALRAVTGQPVEPGCDALLAEMAPNPADDVVVLMART